MHLIKSYTNYTRGGVKMSIVKEATNFVFSDAKEKIAMTFYGMQETAIAEVKKRNITEEEQEEMIARIRELCEHNKETVIGLFDIQRSVCADVIENPIGDKLKWSK